VLEIICGLIAEASSRRTMQGLPLPHIFLNMNALSRFGDAPELLLWQTVSDSLAIPAADVARFQLAALRKRFEQLRAKLPPLANLAAEHGITELTELNQAAALLFKHSVYKSYPLAFIQKGRFDRLTQWLSNLTTTDLSAVRAEGLDSIDDWLDTLEREANLRVIHTTGTSGKLSFLPRGEIDEPLQLRSTFLTYQVPGQPPPEGLEKVPTIVVGYRKMYNAYGAGIDASVKHLYGGNEAMMLTMEPGRLSADVLSLAGRLAGADKPGELGRSDVSPGILARLDQFVELQKTAPARRAQFFQILFDRLHGQRVMMTGNWGMYLEMLQAGTELGARQVFSPDSHFLCAGGTKGKVLPEGYRDNIAAFLGIPEMQEGYGMSEMVTLMPKCSDRKYHALPWMLVFLLDSHTGEPAPRTGTHIGRFGVIDLAIQSRWSGILSGDEVTMTFGKCACGRDGPYLEDSIRRFSEKEGGDDKISCAGAPEAHDNALAFLAELE
jgi:hypothetical protein